MQKVHDVIVVGGGLCGFACAIKCAWSGKSVLLIERRPVLGWESTWAYQLDFGGKGSAVATRIVSELQNVNGFRNNRTDAPILEIALDRMAREAKIDLLLYSYPVRIVYDGDMAFGVVTGSKSGEQIIKGRTIVDATEEALLWNTSKGSDGKAASLQSMFFNNADDEISLPIDLGNGIVLHPSIWKNEVLAEFKVDSFDLLAGRRRIPDVAKIIKGTVPQLKDSLISHTGNELFPLEPIALTSNKSMEHPSLHNLFGAGIWSLDTENTPIGRLNLGEKVGEIASKCDGVKEFPDDMTIGSLFSPSDEAVSDVVVVGGGTGGAIAAIAAGREGVRTKLIEASPVLGGIGTGGAIHSYYHGIDGGIQDEVSQRVNELTTLFAGRWKVAGFHPEVKKIVLQQMLESANVDISLNTVVSGVLCNDIRAGDGTHENITSIAIPDDKEQRREIAGVITVSPNGISIQRANAFIDSTGDGDIAVMAGAPYQLGRERDNLMHAFSQPCGNLSSDGSLMHMNFDAGYVDPTDVDDLTRGRRLGINIFWRETFSDENRLLYIAPIIGLRQSRQIIGEYQLTLSDEISGRRFEDAISYTIAHYDNHGWDYENDSDESALWVWALGNWGKLIGCEVPYRCLIPKNVDGLLLACRAVSMTYDAHMEFRMQKDIQRIGEAAGVAAAISARKGIFPRDIDIKELQSILRARGFLDDKYIPKPAIPADKPLELPAASDLDAESVNELVWVSTHSQPVKALALKMLNSEDSVIRFKASAALAWHGFDEGVNELLKCVEERLSEKPDANKTVPMWQAAIPFLGMAGDKRSIPALLGILKDENASLDALVAAIRAVERIGDGSAIPALHDLLKRDNLPTQRVMQVSTGRLNPAVEDARWQIELSVAEALTKLGATHEEIRKIIQPHLNDPRAYVRRYANKLMFGVSSV